MALKPNLHRFFKYTHNGKYSQNNIDRFISHIDTTPGLGHNGDCWEWTGQLNNAGYGKFNIRKSGIRIYYTAHRVALELSSIKLIDYSVNENNYRNIIILHRCDNKKCIKYDHLLLGTQKDNMHDMIEKHRDKKASGENHGNAKLTWAMVGKIRRLYATNKYSLKLLAKMFEVSIMAISRIINNKTWTNS